jgi:hypothetical protein
MTDIKVAETKKRGGNAFHPLTDPRCAPRKRQRTDAAAQIDKVNPR